MHSSCQGHKVWEWRRQTSTVAPHEWLTTTTTTTCIHQREGQTTICELGSGKANAVCTEAQLKTPTEETGHSGGAARANASSRV